MDIETKQLLVEIYRLLNELNISGQKNIGIVHSIFTMMDRIMEKIIQQQNIEKKQGE